MKGNISVPQFEAQLATIANNPKTPKVAARKLRKLLEDDTRRGVRRRDALYERAQHEFERRKPGKFGDGEFAKWLLAWLQGGGFEKLLSWIVAIMALFA